MLCMPKKKMPPHPYNRMSFRPTTPLILFWMISLLNAFNTRWDQPSMGTGMYIFPLVPLHVSEYILVSIWYSPVYCYQESLEIHKTNQKPLQLSVDPEVRLMLATVSRETGQFIMLSLTRNCTKWDWLTSSHVESWFYILHYSFEKFHFFVCVGLE